jgi:hypothetical protein
MGMQWQRKREKKKHTPIIYAPMQDATPPTLALLPSSLPLSNPSQQDIDSLQKNLEQHIQ